MITRLKQREPSRFVRWFKKFRDKNRPPQRWYDYDQFVG
jgi:hypothetical protein